MPSSIGSYESGPNKSGPNKSRFHVGDELVLPRGIRICNKICLFVQLLGSILILISLIKSIINEDILINLEWQLTLKGLCFVTTGHLLGKFKGFQKLFSIESNFFTSRRSFLLSSLFLLSLVFIIFIRLTSINVHEYKGYFFGEGGLVEWSQVLVLLFSIRLGILITNEFRVKKISSRISLVYTFITILLSIIALEELSWGQVIFSWKTPETLTKLNAQNETTLHNLHFFQNILDISFLIISLIVFIFVIASPLLSSLVETRWKILKLFPLSTFLPPIYSWPLFISALFISFFVAIPLLPNVIINRDQEWGELFLYIGILISLLRTYILLDRPIKKAFNL